jgi:predicted aldo/keto reductase-like oxidoreductase
MQKLWNAHPVKRSPVEWALRFVWDDPRVSVLLSGMSTMDHVVTNVAVAATGEAGALTASDRALIEEVRHAYKARTAVDCTACRYCLPCPQGIEIPLVFGCVNNSSLFEDIEGEKIGYKIEVELKHTAPASACSECGQCEDACPQHLQIIKELADAARMFE